MSGLFLRDIYFAVTAPSVTVLGVSSVRLEQFDILKVAEILNKSRVQILHSQFYKYIFVFLMLKTLSKKDSLVAVFFVVNTER